jgi:hypothetical protein
MDTLFLFIMTELTALLTSWNTPDFEAELQQALKQLDVNELPLKQVATCSGVFIQEGLGFSLLSTHENKQLLILKLGVFYQEISNLCPCSGDQPETVDGHCEMQMTINKSAGLIDFAIV